MDDDAKAGQDAAVTIKGLVKVYRAGLSEPVRAADGIDLAIARGSATALTGPSGSGKSTLLHLIGALDPADSGSITVDGREVTALKGRALAGYRRTVGFVFQRFHLMPTLSALDNVLAPVLPYRTPYDKRERARELLDRVGLADRASHLPAQLSGGQQQRVAVARALINRPALVLADEPTGNLDSKTAADIVDLLLDLRAEHGTTLVVATHDPAIAERCDTVVHLVDGRLAEPATM